VGICIIGHFGGDGTWNDGQTVKTRTIYDALQKYGVPAVSRVDTYYVRKNPVRFCFQLAASLFRDKKYIVLLSTNGRKVLFPVLFVMSRFLRKEVYHYAIGGRLAREAGENKNWKRYISAFKGNWMESTLLTNQLQAMGIKNAVYVPNFKRLQILTEEELPASFERPFRLCTFSRVMPEKGIEDAIRAVQSLNGKAGEWLVTLDIYGPVPEAYKGLLQELLGQSADCRYCGVVEAGKSVEALKAYYLLLFPTNRRHEGMPGTIIDALSAGLPVVARRWRYCDEMLTHGETGYIYDFDQPEKLEELIEYAVTHERETAAMRPLCLRKAVQYSEERVMEQILSEMGLRQDG